MLICIDFPPGAGGHFIAQIVSNLLFETPINISASGDCHKINPHILRFFAVNGGPKNIRGPIALFHETDLTIFEDIADRVIYITTSTRIEQEIVAGRLNNKDEHRKSVVNPEIYQVIRGVDWCEYQDLTEEKINIYTEELKILNQHHVSSWTYTMPENHNNFLKIDFSQLTNINTLEDICEFLNIHLKNREYVLEKMVEYQKINEVLDAKGRH